MTPLVTINLLRGLFVIFTAFVGISVGGAITGSQLTGASLGLAFGLMIVLCDRLLEGFSLRLFSSATLGLLLGSVLARFLLGSGVLRYIPEEGQWLIGLLVYAAFSYLGMMLAIRSSRDEFALIIPYVRFQQSAVQDAPLLIDTNIIIDGRIATLCATGFVSRSLVVPRFVLEELQRLADSAEPLKRERGKRGLDGLNQLKKNPQLSVTIHESELDSADSVDNRLLLLAKLLQARLLTNDGNLCKIARLQNIPVLNLNDLSQAVRPLLSAGDELEIALVKEGRDAHQAVGYLPDGTMIIVNHSRARIGETVQIRIASTVQTSGGRLFFAELTTPS